MYGKRIGYEFLKETLGTCAFPQERPARVASVTKVTALANALVVPAQVAPASDAPLEHLLCALKHEGLQLQAAILALKKMGCVGRSGHYQNGLEHSRGIVQLG